MSGDVTSVPLRERDRWTGARMQQGRVLLDTDWNLTLDGAARETRDLARAAIGPAGVAAGSDAFGITFIGGALTIRAGAMWIGGLLARNPVDLPHAAQPGIPDLPASGLAAIYLDAFAEEVQGPEDPAEVLDPALDGIDTTTRQRVGWRVRAVPVASPRCGEADLPPGRGTGTLDVERTSAPPPADACAPPDDPLGRLPDGLLRIEVLDAGTAQTARFGWSYAAGSETLAASVAGATATVTASPALALAVGDLVEVSTLDRRADRRDHGPLHTVTAVVPGPGGDTVTLAPASTVAGNPPGISLRRWDGQGVGAAAGITATFDGEDLGVRFRARPGTYLAGEWWGVRIRGSAADGIELRSAAAPDGVLHHLAPLAVVDLDAAAVLTDCRRTFRPLTELRGGTCTVVAFPGDDLQAALDALPSGGGILCLAAGRYDLAGPLRIQDRHRIVVSGVGPATVLAITSSETVLVASRCTDLEIRSLRVEAGQPPTSPPGESGLLGAITVLDSDGLLIRDCQITCPDSDDRAQSCLHVGTGPEAGGAGPGRTEIRHNRLEVGSHQVGVLVVSGTETVIVDNDVRLATASIRRVPRLLAAEFARYVAQQLLPTAGGRELRRTGPPSVRELAAAWARRLPDDGPRTEASLRRFVIAALTEPGSMRLGGTTTATLLPLLLENARVVGQGIVVGGARAERVLIEGNTVAPALQGLHAGLQARGLEPPLRAREVRIHANTVGCVVPSFWSRGRHAVYVGNADRISVLDNHASLSRWGFDRGPAPVDAVRIWGALGPWVQVRGLDLRGPFRTGLVLRDTAPASRDRQLRYVSDVLNADGAQAVDASPPLQLSPDRCLP